MYHSSRKFQKNPYSEAQVKRKTEDLAMERNRDEVMKNFFTVHMLVR